MISYISRAAHAVASGCLLTTAFFLIKYFHLQSCSDDCTNETIDGDCSCDDVSSNSSSNEFGRDGKAMHDAKHTSDIHSSAHSDSDADTKHENEDHLSHIFAEHELEHAGDAGRALTGSLQSNLRSAVEEVTRIVSVKRPRHEIDIRYPQSLTLHQGPMCMDTAT